LPITVAQKSFSRRAGGGGKTWHGRHWTAKEDRDEAATVRSGGAHAVARDDHGAGEGARARRERGEAPAPPAVAPAPRLRDAAADPARPGLLRPLPLRAAAGLRGRVRGLRAVHRLRRQPVRRP